MSVRRLPPGDNPFRPLRCRDVALLMAGLVLLVLGGAVSTLVLALGG